MAGKLGLRIYQFPPPDRSPNQAHFVVVVDKSLFPHLTAPPTKRTSWLWLTKAFSNCKTDGRSTFAMHSSSSWILLSCKKNETISNAATQACPKSLFYGLNMGLMFFSI